MALNDKKVNIIIRAKDFASSKFKSLGKSLLSLKSLVIGGLGFVGLKQLFDATVGSMATLERMTGKLETAMKSAGRFSNEAFKELTNFAVEMEDATGQAEENILQAMTILQTFGRMTKEDLKASTVAILDMAAVMDTDLKSAALSVGKAYVGQISALTRVGVSIDEAKFKTEGFQAVLDQLAVEQGGQAIKQMEGFSGSLKSLGHAFDGTLESIGKFITKSETMMNILNGLKDTFISITDWLDAKRDSEKEASVATATHTILVSKLRDEMNKLGKTHIFLEHEEQIAAANKELNLMLPILDKQIKREEKRIEISNKLLKGGKEQKIEDSILYKQKAALIENLKKLESEYNELRKDKSLLKGWDDIINQIGVAIEKTRELGSVEKQTGKEEEEESVKRRKRYQLSANLLRQRIQQEEEAAELRKKIAEEEDAAELAKLEADFRNLQKRANATKAFHDKLNALINESARKEINTRLRVSRTLADMQANTLRKTLTDAELHWDERKRLLAEQEEKAQSLFDRLTSGEKLTATEFEKVIEKIKEQKEALSDVEGAEAIFEILNAAEKKMFEVFKTIEDSPIVPKIDFTDAVIQSQLGGKRASAAFRKAFEEDQRSNPITPKINTNSIASTGD